MHKFKMIELFAGPLMRWGKGAKNPGKSFTNLTTHQRAATPYDLGLDIAQQLKKSLDLQFTAGLSNHIEFSILNLLSEKTTSLEARRATISSQVISNYL